MKRFKKLKRHSKNDVKFFIFIWTKAQAQTYTKRHNAQKKGRKRCASNNLVLKKSAKPDNVPNGPTFFFFSTVS